MKYNNYNFIAPIYDQLTRLIFFGRIQNAQLEYLTLLPEKGRILFIGGGTGSTLEKLIQLKPNLEVDYVDPSSKMISLSKKKISKLETNKVNFICGDESNIPAIQYDGILSFFYFDLFWENEAAKIFSQLISKLKVSGIWLVADFHQAKNWHQKLLELLMYSFLGLATKIKTSKIPPVLSLINTSELFLVKEKFYFNHFIFSKAFSKSSWNKN